MSNPSCKADRIQDSSATNDDDITATIEIRVVEALEHPFDDVDIILNIFTTRYGLDVSDDLHVRRMIAAKCVDSTW